MKHLATLLFVLIIVSCAPEKIKEVDYGSNSKTGKYVEVNDIKIYYEVYGEGEPLLLIHGNGGSIENFIYQIPEFAKQYKVIVVDSRAQGRSSDSDQEISYSLMASDMSEFIDKLNLGKVHVVGWSDGGNVGLELAYAHPEKVSKAVIFGANYSHENYNAVPDSIAISPNHPAINHTALVLERYRSGNERLSLNKERLPIIKKKLTALMEKYPNFTLEQLNTIQVPFMVVVGDHDSINIEQTILLYQNLPQAQLFVLPGASHFSLIEYPELANKEILRFFKTPFQAISNNYYYTK
jgi:pimeloyl-ACP methyl ester carboxylesterase